MDPDQVVTLLAAAGAGLGAIGFRRRKSALDDGRRITPGMALGRVGARTARQAGNVTGLAGRMAVDTAAAGIRVSGAVVAVSVGLAVDGAAGLISLVCRPATPGALPDDGAPITTSSQRTGRPEQASGAVLEPSVT